MKRALLAVAAVALSALTTSTASAQYPQAGGMPQGYGGMPPQGYGGMPPQGYGGMPGGQMGPGGPQGQQGYAEAQVKMETYQSRYGFHPFLSRLFCPKKGCSTCAGGNCSHTGWFSFLCQKHFPAGAGGGYAGGANQIPPAQGGTLVFPNHPFVRSPRDYFMVDQ